MSENLFDDGVEREPKQKKRARFAHEKSVLDDEQSTLSKKIEVLADTNVRTNAGTSNPIIGVVSKGKRLDYLDKSEKHGSIVWYLVPYNGEKSWVSGKYTRIME